MKMRPASAAVRGFTLIEILVVIVIIAVLASLIASQVIRMIDDGNRLKTREMMTSLKTGITGFVADYGRLPLDEVKEEEYLTEGSSSLVDAVTGIVPEGGGVNLNPRGTKFAEFRPAQNGRHGLVADSRPLKLHDMWGNPFRVLLDANGDHQIKNPDAQNSDPRLSQPGGKPAPEHLVLDVAIYSCGKDGLPLTGDDIASWRDP